MDSTEAPRTFLFLLASARSGGNSEQTARRAAQSLPDHVAQTWLDLDETPMPPFVDIRHEGSGEYPPPEGAAADALAATLAATDIVFVAPLYWYALPAAAKLYLDHWSGWLRVPDANFRGRMAGKRMWAISASTTSDPLKLAPALAGLAHSAAYLMMEWKGSLLANASRPGDAMTQPDVVERAVRFFS